MENNNFNNMDNTQNVVIQPTIFQEEDKELLKKKKRRNRIILVVLLIAFFASLAIIVVPTLIAAPAVTGYLDSAKTDLFSSNAKAAISAVKNDMVMTDQTSAVYTLSEINNIIEKKLETSPFGEKYKESSCITAISNNSVSGDFTISMCLIDEGGNGFTLTKEENISSEIIKGGELKDIECSCN